MKNTLSQIEDFHSELCYYHEQIIITIQHYNEIINVVSIPTELLYDFKKSYQVFNIIE